MREDQLSIFGEVPYPLWPHRMRQKLQNLPGCGLIALAKTVRLCVDDFCAAWLKPWYLAWLTFVLMAHERRGDVM